ncbi:hypothetical protein [Streptomyces sp. PT12]|uniref:hypothetical protein n=1 Tax=Streptomyces sp. PT12 TaxID=1510197 RepID=UPI000E02E4B7|nr:hypothetical protein [Streptomyces sp. PT12]RBM11100.1 hypothetical protein DEH69_22160 [Streptomyces sp. PT12]
MSPPTRITVPLPALIVALVTAPAAAAPTSGADEERPAWKTASAARLTHGSGLVSVTSADALHAWDVGGQTSERNSPTGALPRWNGLRWAEDRPPGLPEVPGWHSVNARSPRDVWAYGSNGQEELTPHFDGRRWSRVELPELPNAAGSAASARSSRCGRRPARGRPLDQLVP